MAPEGEVPGALPGSESRPNPIQMWVWVVPLQETDETTHQTETDEKKKEEKEGVLRHRHCINCRYITPSGQVTFPEYGIPRDYSVSSTHSIFVPMSKSNGGGGASKLPCGVACVAVRYVVDC